MFEHMFMPLSRHADDGLGAVGCVFYRAADYLRKMKCDGGAAWTHGHLPINFLYRHSIELFLKSMIVVIHRRLRLSSENGEYDPTPKIGVGGSWKPIYCVHSTRALFDAMRNMVTSHREPLSKIAKTNWADIPHELEDWIDTIDKVDHTSTVFRYPSTRTPEIDTQKSSFKPMDPLELSGRMRMDGPGQFALVMVDQDANVLESFVLDDKPLPEFRDALERASETLLGAQLGIMAELGQGVVG